MMAADNPQDDAHERIVIPGEIAVWESKSGSYGGYIPPLWEKDGIEYYRGRCKSCRAWILALFEPDGGLSSRNLDFTFHKCGGEK
jgi:hypothetical protein